MRQILIQDRETKLFYDRQDHWTSSAAKARNFETSLNAIAHCVENGLLNAQLVVKFGTPGACDVVIPVRADDQRYVA